MMRRDARRLPRVVAKLSYACQKKVAVEPLAHKIMTMDAVRDVNGYLPKSRRKIHVVTLA